MRIKHKIFIGLTRFQKRALQQACKDSIRLSQIRRILVLSTTALGDTLLSTPVFAALRKAYPQATISAMIRDRYCSFFKNNPDLDDIIPLHKGWIGFYKAWKKVKKAGFDIAFVSHISDPGPLIIASLADIPHIIGYWRQKEFDHLFSLKIIPNLKEHLIENRLDYVRSIIGPEVDLSANMVLPLDPEETEKIWGTFVAQHKIFTTKTKIIGFHPGANRYYQRWPKEHFIELGKKIMARDKHYVIIISGSKNEILLGKAIEDGIGQKERAFFYARPLAELPHVFRKIDCLVTNDTGPMHVAIAIGTPTVSLFVAALPHRTGYYQDFKKHRIISKERPCGDECIRKKCTKKPGCMSLITVDEVFDVTMEVINKLSI
ncbi:MAG: glycosyltransferase family 9 protein [Desulfosarcina sp.]|nr:glycosyltransferase family 9 protein [Desulfobacterales bacterium]